MFCPEGEEASHGTPKNALLHNVTTDMAISQHLMATIACPTLFATRFHELTALQVRPPSIRRLPSCKSQIYPNVAR